ncbi:hypothetical protein [Bdellovibrio sp. HCB288]|uniref:hypothetical protein n=1 Tax=Bdellovibrio sp. HCB288 TaxID=3394355 RepID=UPI0039B612AD
MVGSKFTALVAGLSCAALLAGCEGAQSEKDMIMEAQYCLDKATPSTAQSCVAGIASLTSENSYAIRCAAGFLKSGVTTASNLAQAFTALSEDSDTATMLSILNFDEDTGLANETAGYCTKSGSSGLALMGAMAKSATALASSTSTFPSCSGGIASCDPDEITNLIEDIEDSLTAGSGDPGYAKAIETITAVAGSVQAVYAISCGQSGANQDICGPINEALVAATITPEELASLTTPQLEELGKELLAKWK